MFRLLRCPLSLLLVIVLLLPLDLRAIDLAVPSAAAPSLQPARNSYAAGQHGAARHFCEVICSIIQRAPMYPRRIC